MVKEMEEEEEGLIVRLPEECISKILSFTSPKDSCRSAAVSKAFLSAVESDVVWERFLPPDYKEMILSAAVVPVEFSSKKELYFRLSEPLLVDGGKKSFVLQKSGGKKCYMVSARELSIIWGDTPNYWRWISSFQDSRFSEVAELLSVCWLEISGKIETAMLSPETTYVAYLIFKLTPNSYGLGSPFQKASVSMGTFSITKIVCLDDGQDDGVGHVPHANARADGWMELELGEFFNHGNGDGDEEVDIRLVANNGTSWKRGLIVEGMEFRPQG